MAKAKIAPKEEKLSFGAKMSKELKKAKRNKFLLLLMLPGLVYYIIFHYIPMGGLLIAFKEFKPSLGILRSPWASHFGFGHFVRFIQTPDMLNYVWNTIALSLLHIIWLFPLAIILALFINELKSLKFKKVVQTVSYLPHFVSVAAIAGMLTLFLSSQGTASTAESFANEGLLNQFLLKLGLIDNGISFLDEAKWFRTITIVGLITCTEMYHIFCTLEAPSSVAAS